MADIRRILCPIDFSEASRHALQHAVAIAGWYESQITALHVYNPVFLPVPPILMAEFPGAALPTQTERHQMEEDLRAWLAPAKAAGVRAEIEFVEGKPAAQILDRAASLPADLIVMGTHGRGGFERLLLGSVAEKVLRKASCPVLTVPPPAASKSKLPFKRLLCPVDFSEPSIAALRFAISIAKEADARVTLVHVFECPPDDELLAERAFDVLEYRRQVEERSTRQLDDLLSDDERNWCRPTIKLSYGKPYRQILTMAENQEADLIVMGVHGRNALDLMLFGSTTNQVVRRASCPVLTLRR